MTGFAWCSWRAVATPSRRSPPSSSATRPRSSAGWSAIKQEGESGLQDRPRSGRPRKADAVARSALCQAVEQTPAQLGYRFGYWTTGTLVAHLAQAGRDLPERGDRSSRAAPAGLSLAVVPASSCRSIPPRPPSCGGCTTASCRLPRTAAIVCLDECDVHLLPVLRAMWMRRAQQVDVPSPGTNRKRAVFGALEWSTRALAATRSPSASGRASSSPSWSSSRWPMPLVRCSWCSTTRASTTRTRSRAWLGEHTQVQLLFLPAYSGHRHNPVEKVWWRLKDQIAANRLHGSIDAMVVAIHDFFATFTRRTPSG